jgi:DNA repair protein RadC
MSGFAAHLRLSRERGLPLPDPEAALERVRRAVAALPGAGEVRAEWADPAAASSIDLDGPTDEAARAAFRRAAKRAVLEVLGPPRGLAEASSAWRIGLPAAAPPAPEDDAALTEALLGLACPNSDVPALTRALLARFRGFAGLLAARPLDLATVPGLNGHGLSAILLLREAVLRLLRARMERAPLLTERAALHAFLAAAMGRERIEQFRLIFLDEEGRLIGEEAQARGTVNHTPVYPREVVRRAVELGAASVVMTHNHPSGDPTPSSADLEMTEEVARALAVLGIALADHVIVGNGRFLSFAEEGLPPFRRTASQAAPAEKPRRRATR